MWWELITDLIRFVRWLWRLLAENRARYDELYHQPARLGDGLEKV